VGRTHKKFPKYQEDQRQFFDELVTNDWNDYLSKDWDEERSREIGRLFKLISPRRILDVGCGSGYHDLLMANFGFVEEVLGIDYSKKSVEVANKEYPHPKVKREVSDIVDLKPELFDLVVSFQVIEHLTDPEAFLIECKKHCNDGGWIAVFTPNRKRLTNRLRALLRLDLVLEDPQHFAEYTVHELTRLGTRLGLTVIDDFSYNLTLEVPKFGWQIVPKTWSKHVGKLIPKFANRFAVVFQTSGNSASSLDI
jgi:2-polyprenyl-3-methyl-5-hydroxy-6-metoxy-1,4-benzoquinol methylase